MRTRPKRGIEDQDSHTASAAEPTAVNFTARQRFIAHLTMAQFGAYVRRERLLALFLGEDGAAAVIEEICLDPTTPVVVDRDGVTTRPEAQAVLDAMDRLIIEARRVK